MGLIAKIKARQDSTRKFRNYLGVLVLISSRACWIVALLTRRKKLQTAHLKRVEATQPSSANSAEGSNWFVPAEFTSCRWLSAETCRLVWTEWTRVPHTKTSVRGPSRLGCLDWLRWAWESSPDAINKHHWFVFIRDALMHHSTVPVLLNVGSESLALLTPNGLTWLLMLHCPCCEP